MEESSKCGNSMDILQSYLEKDPCLLTDLQLSISSDSSDIISEEEDSGGDGNQAQNFAEISQKLLDELEMLEEEFQNKAVLLEEEDSKGVQGSKDDNTLEQLGQQSIPTSNHLPEDKPLNHVEDRLPQPEPGQGTSGSSTTRKENHQPKEDLEETVKKLLEEKKQNTAEIEQLKRQIQKLTEEVKDERLERKSLALKLQKSQRKFLQLNRVSLAVTQDYAEMMGQLELEQDLRLEAEIMAHQMLKEKRAVSRQSMILMQNLEPSQMLIKALEDVRTLTTTLEETKAELQTQVKSLELQLAERPSQEEFIVIKEELNTANLQKNQLEEQLKVEQEKCVDLQEKVKTLEEKLKENELLVIAQGNVEMVAEPVPPPPPPPPPPPVCPSSKAPNDPLALVRERRGLRTPAAKVMTVSPNVKEKAIQEMKQRIEQGAILRPTPKIGQRECAANKRKSVISELQGVLLNTARKPLKRGSRRRISRKAKDNELNCLLKKRRQIVDHNPPADKTDETSKQTQEQTAEAKRQAQEEGGSQAPEVASPLQNNPVLLKVRQRTSPIESRRSSQVQWQ